MGLSGLPWDYWDYHGITGITMGLDCMKLQGSVRPLNTDPGVSPWVENRAGRGKMGYFHASASYENDS